MRQIWCLVFLWSLVFGAWSFSARAQPSREYPLKAVFVYNFAQFTEWPPEAFATKDSPLVIGILGTDPFGSILDETVNNETVHGRRLVIERYQRLEQIQNCHILYIGHSELGRLGYIADELKAKPVLTVSESTGSIPQGIMIGFMTEKNKIRLRINLEAARAANLTISSKLLRTAEIVSEKK